MTYEDSERYRQLRNNEWALKWFIHRERIGKEEHKTWYNNYLTDIYDVMFSIYYNNSYCGSNGLYHIDYNLKTAEYGRIVIDQRYKGNGLGCIATLAAMKIAKECIGLRHLYLEALYDNTAALISYLRCGFVIDDIWLDIDGNKLIRMDVDL